MFEKDITVVKNLAAQYAEIANKDENLAKYSLHTGVNDLKMKRPIVLIDEFPWGEFKNEPELEMQCCDERMRRLERYFREEIYKYNHFPADRIFQPYFSVPHVVHSEGFGIDIDESTIESDNGGISAHAYNDCLKNEEALAKLKTPDMTYDEKQTMENFCFHSEILARILPVKIEGASGGRGIGHSTWDYVSMLRGVSNLLFDLAERPEFMHQIAEKFADITIRLGKKYEEMGLLNSSRMYIHCTAGLTNDLRTEDPENVKLKEIWGRGVAQIFAAVSPAMHDEFDIQYAKKVLEPFGLVYYGCCEPLDKKIDILRQIKNLRKISITPWANINIAAEAIGRDYVVAVKPNPSSLSVANLDEQAVKKELTDLYNACCKNNCSFEFTMKDISSVGKNPRNLEKWEQIAMSIVKG